MQRSMEVKLKDKRVLTPGGRSLKEYFQAMVQYRGLVWTLAKRDIKGRYAQSYLGWLWIFGRAGFTLFFFTLIFDNFLHVGSDDLPYPIFAFSGMTVWYFFAGLTQNAGMSMITAGDLIRKIYFPKLVLPFSKVLEVAVEFVVHIVILVIGLFIFGVSPTLTWLFIPLTCIPVLLLGLVCGLWLSIFTLKIRDLQHIIPFILNFGIWLTPVFYPISIVPQKYQQLVYIVNPLVSSLDALRWVLNPQGQFPWIVVPISLFLAVLLMLGMWLFQKKDGNMVDNL